MTESQNDGQAENSLPPKTMFCGGGGGGVGGGIKIESGGSVKRKIKKLWPYLCS